MKQIKQKPLLKLNQNPYRETLKYNQRPIVKINFEMCEFDEIKAVEKFLDWCARKNLNPSNFAIFSAYKEYLLTGKCFIDEYDDDD